MKKLILVFAFLCFGGQQELNAGFFGWLKSGFYRPTFVYHLMKDFKESLVKCSFDDKDVFYKGVLKFEGAGEHTRTESYKIGPGLIVSGKTKDESEAFPGEYSCFRQDLRFADAEFKSFRSRPMDSELLNDLKLVFWLVMAPVLAHVFVELFAELLCMRLAFYDQQSLEWEQHHPKRFFKNLWKRVTFSKKETNPKTLLLRRFLKVIVACCVFWQASGGWKPRFHAIPKGCWLNFEQWIYNVWQFAKS